MSKRMTHDEFMIRLVQGNEALLDKVEILGKYINKRTSILGRTKYGLVNLNPLTTLVASHINIRSAVNKSAYYTNIANERHNNYYTYKNTKFISETTELTVTCPLHGDFKVLPKRHLKRGGGCTKCEATRNIMLNNSEEEYINRINKANENTLNNISLVEGFKGSGKYMYALHKHGLVYLQGLILLNGSEIGKEHSVNREKFILSMFKERHKDRYNYDLYVFNSLEEPVQIVCKLHGIFLKSPAHHIGGLGCPTCGREEGWLKHTITHKEFLQKLAIKNQHAFKDLVFLEGYKHGNTTLRAQCPTGVTKVIPNRLLQGRNYMGNLGGWSRSNYVNRTRGLSNCYLVCLYDGNEKFYKIGISIDIQKRLSTKQVPYNYKLIKKIKGSAEFVWDLEQALQKRHRLHGLKYLPIKSFKGETECFTELLSVETIDNTIADVKQLYKEKNKEWQQ